MKYLFVSAFLCTSIYSDRVTAERAMQVQKETGKPFHEAYMDVQAVERAHYQQRNGYYRKNGEYVNPHGRTRANGNRRDNRRSYYGR